MRGSKNSSRLKGGPTIMPPWIRFGISPYILLSVPSVVAVAIWMLFPREVVQDWGVMQVADWKDVWQVLLLTLGMFSCGIFFARPLLTSFQSWDFDVERCRRGSRFLLLLGWGGFVLMMALTFADGGSARVIACIRGVDSPEYIMGVTTNVHVSSILVPALWGLSVASRRQGWNYPWVKRHLAVAALLAFARYVTGGERLALLIPFVASFLVTLGLRERRAGAFAMKFAALVLAGVFAVFVASEALRSYAVKASSDRVNVGLVQYSAQRMGMYYMASVNNGGQLYALSHEGLATEGLFTHTIAPMASVISALFPRFYGAYGGTNANQVVIKEGYRPKELTNVWGMAGPFLEQHYWGLFYWLLMGGVSAGFYAMFNSRLFNPIGLAIYGVWGAGLVDVSRVNMLASIHILWPMAFGVYLLLWSRPNPSMLTGSAAKSNRGGYRREGHVA